MKIIRRYKNRKLYDTELKGYTSLSTLREFTKQGINFQVVDKETGNDVTYQTQVGILANTLTYGETKQVCDKLTELIAGLE